MSKTLKEKQFNELVAYINSICPDMAKLIADNKNQFVPKTYGEILTFDKIYALQCACFCKAASFLSGDEQYACYEAQERAFNKMQEHFPVFLELDKRFTKKQLNSRDIKFNWESICKYIDKLAEQNGYVKYSVEDNPSFTLSQLKSCVLILENGMLNNYGHFRVGLIRSIDYHTNFVYTKQPL